MLIIFVMMLYFLNELSVKKKKKKKVSFSERVTVHFI